MKKKILLALIASILCGCNALLDKDNTPEPAQLVHFKPEANLQLKWYTQAGQGSGTEYLKLSPTINNGRIFAASQQGLLSALDANTGKILWQTNTAQSISTGIAANDKFLYLGTQTGKIIAFSQTNGATEWKAKTSSEVLAPPAISQNKLLVKSIDGRVTAYDANNGQKQWHYQQSEPNLILRGSSAPQIKQGEVIVGFENGKLASLELDSGNVRWVKTIAQPEGSFSIQRMVDIDANPVIQNNKVYAVTYQGNVMALGLGSGDTLWSHHISSYSGMTVDKEQVYVSDADSHVWAFDNETGVVNWRQNALTARHVTGPVIFGPYVAVADEEGYIHLMNKKDGHFVSRQFVNSSGILANPIVKNQTLYVMTKNGYLAAYTLG